MPVSQHRRHIHTSLLALLLLVSALPAPRAQAQLANGSGFASAVPCLSAAPTFATTSMANTILNNGVIAPGTDPALLQVTRSSQAKLAPLGSSHTPDQNSRIANGMGATYGLAYDDGSVSGMRRLFAAAYLKRSVGFSATGPGAIFEYRFSDGSWRLATSVPNVGSESRPASDLTDRSMADQVGLVGLGDLELAPDGRTLYAMNLFTRQVERYELSGETLVRQAPLSLPFGLISADPGVQADLRPFALGFAPSPSPSVHPTLVVGVVDSGARGFDTRWNAWPHPTAYVLAATSAGSGGWSVALTQDLRTPSYTFRLTYSSFFAAASPEETESWNPWYPLSFAHIATSDHHVRFPEPLVTDITFTHDGQRMFVGLRDRVGDQLFSTNPPAPESSALAQGDILTYQLVGGTWVLQGDRFGDFFDDNTPSGAHIENFMGAAGINLGGAGPNGFSEQLMATALLGAYSSGTRTYAASGGAITSQQTLHAFGTPASGKAAALGDLEVLCTAAFLGGRIWQDTNGNGVQDHGEPSVPDLILEVAADTDATTPPLATLSTDAQGRYLFAVPPNTPLSIRIGAASRSTLAAQGWRLTTPNVGANDATDSDASDTYGLIEVAAQPYASVGGGVTGAAVPMPLNRADLRTLDLGLTRTAPTGVIGDRVWLDTDRDGLQDADEPGQPGVRITLSADPTSAEVLPIPLPQTTTSDNDGGYAFSALPPGRYRVTFGPLPALTSPTRRDVGSDDGVDSDADASSNLRSPTITLSATSNDTSIDLGLDNSLDVWVSKHGPAQALVGSVISYTLDYGNSGAQPAAGVQLVDSLPAGLTFVAADPPPSAVSGQRLTWELGSLAPGQSEQIHLSVRAPTSIGAATRQTSTNQATIHTTSPNDRPENNTSSSSTELVRPELRLTKSAPVSVIVGDDLTYTLEYANVGTISAADVSITDPLPAGVVLTGFLQNPAAACAYSATSNQVSCSFPSLEPGASGRIMLSTRAEVSAAATVVNTGHIQTATVGDDPSDNHASASTTVQFPNPGVSVHVEPSPFPVGSSGRINLNYQNAGSGVARAAIMRTALPLDVAISALPGDCMLDAASRTLTCSLGDLAPGASGTRSIPIALPASFPADQIAVTATITTTTPERPADQADNQASALVDVVRPNVWVQAAGPTSIVGQGSAFWYTLDYGNQHRANPGQTYTATGVMLQATLPADVSFVQADQAPSSVSGQRLIWDLGTLQPNHAGQIHIVVQTHVPAGASLHFATRISTSTPGDDPSDNTAAVDTVVVPPPDHVSQGQSDLRLAIHSDLDPDSQDGEPANGVYVSDGTDLAWPAGEVLDLTPRLTNLRFPDEPLPFPYEYRARVVGWSLAGFTLNGVHHDAQATDSRGVAGCRAGARPSRGPQLLAGCAYAYLGGDSRAAIASPAALTEAELASQAHLYATQPPAPRMRSDVYLFTLDPLGAIQVGLQVEVEVWIVNAAPGAIGGIPLPEIPVVPLPDPERQRLEQTFSVNLLVPRSVIAPDSR